MKRITKYFLILTAAFLIGVSAVFFFFYQEQKNASPIISEPVIESNDLVSEVNTETNNENETISLVENIWTEEEKISYEDYQITKKCLSEEEYSAPDDNCTLKIFKNKKLLTKFNSSHSGWLQHGFFNFLGKNDKQLIVNTYSGGAHCCDDYIIYELKPSFRTIYDTRKLDSGSDIGNQLIPVDIDGDGIFEFYQSVMTFDYFYESHAGSVFPPAVFAFDKDKNEFVLANKKFPNFVMKELDKNLRRVENYTGKNQSENTRKMYERYIVRMKFLYLVYAGKESKAWEYFNENYVFEDKEDYRQDVKKKIFKDLTYKSIYKN